MSRLPRLRAAVIRSKALGLLGSSACVLACSGAAEIPNTPDLSALQAAYDVPTATLDSATAVETLRQMPSLPELVAGFRAAGYAVNGVDRASADPPVANLRVQGSIHVTVRCPGEFDQAAYGANGTFSFMLGVEKNLIKRGIAGEASHCVLQGHVLGQPVRVEVNGPVSFDLGRDLGLRQRWSGRLLMNIAGTLDIAGYVLEDLSARWTDDRVEYLYTLKDGSTVVALVTDQGAVAIRDRQIIWGCGSNEACVAQ